MNIIEQFDYEHKILDDIMSVKTTDAVKGIVGQLKSILDEHKAQIKEILTKFHSELVAERTAKNEIMAGRTPQYVLNIMKEFGFKEPEFDELSVNPASYDMRLDPNNDFHKQIVEDINKVKEFERNEVLGADLPPKKTSRKSKASKNGGKQKNSSDSGVKAPETVNETDSDK